MSVAEAVLTLAGPNWTLRRQRAGWVLGFWLGGLSVLEMRHLLLLRLHSEMEASRQWIELSEGARLWLLLLPIAFFCGALAMQICWLPLWGRVLSWAAAMVVIPPWLLLVAIWVSAGPHRLDSVAAGGHEYVLATGGRAFDDALTLYEVADIAGLTWRNVNDVFDYPENKALTGDEHLVVSPDGRWLIFSRGGLWLDCFRLADGRASHVEIEVAGPGNFRTIEFDPRRRSTRIAALTGLRP